MRIIRKNSATVVLVCVAAVLGACQPKATTGTVAILDLQRVADETGYSRTITQHIDGLRNTLQGELTKVQSELSTKLSEKQEKFGDKPNEKQKDELNQLFVNAKVQLQQAQQQAVNVVQRERDSLVLQLHDLLRPYAKKVANEHGMQIVMIKSQTMVFDHDPTTDITDEVIAAVVQAKANFVPKVDQVAPAAEAVSKQDGTATAAAPQG